MVRPRVLIYRVVMTRVQDGEDDNDNNVTTEDNAGEEERPVGGGGHEGHHECNYGCQRFGNELRK